MAGRESSLSNGMSIFFPSSTLSAEQSALGNKRYFFPLVMQLKNEL
jgi:hypothetical protein